VVGGVRFGLIEPSMVREHILSMADKEWDPEDFVRSGKDLRNATWKLEKVRVRSVRMRAELIRSRGVPERFAAADRKDLEVDSSRPVDPTSGPARGRFPHL